MAKGNISSAAILRHESGWTEEGVDSWHVSEGVTKFPRTLDEFQDVEALADRYFFSSFGPAQPFVERDDRILTIGSCFADRLRKYLELNGYPCDFIDIPIGLNNTFAVRQYLEWGLTGNRSSDAYWYDVDSKNRIIQWEPREEQEEVKRAIQSSKLLVISIGVAEVWRDRETGGVFWRGVPCSLFDERKHECVLSTVEENVRNFAAVHNLLRELSPETALVITLSPVPLVASFLGMPVFVADCMGKSVLRTAIGEFMRGNPEHTYYWPSFEFVRWLGGHLPYSAYGADHHPRHVDEGLVKIVVDSFVARFMVKD